MLRSERRWHDAANGPLLDREARLLWFATNPTPAVPTPPPDDTDDDVDTPPAEQSGADAETNEASATHAQAQEAVAQRATVEQNLSRRKAERLLLDHEADSTLKASDVLGRLNALHQDLEQRAGTFTHIESMMGRAGATEAQQKEIAENKKIVTEHVARIRAQAHALKHLQVTEWQEGKVSPKEFVERYKLYAVDMDAIDDMTLEAELQSFRESGIWDPEKVEKLRQDKEERAKARQQLIEDVEAAVREASATLPKNLPADVVQKVETMDDKELWALYNLAEKNQIIAKISGAAGFDVILTSVNDDVQAITEALEENKVKEKMMKKQREIIELESKPLNLGSVADAPGGGAMTGNALTNAWNAAHAGLNAANDALGIEWLTAYEWMEAFTEVWESVKELRKQKSRIRVASAAAKIGQVAALVPGFGGKALTNLLEQQQESKNEEIKESFLKELKNNRVDLSFSDLFGSPGGGGGYLAYYHQIGDTNRTQAILEFAADKAMLYGMNDYAWNTYVLPGNIPFRSLLPREWSDKQVDNWYSNLGFRNKQGEDSQIKAGETLASGRSKFEDYTNLFSGLVNGMSLWFAKGVANAALKKVKNGEMSATLMLIVADAWEHNPLFRKYAHLEKDWWDRLSGDSKPMRIGMVKYDQMHFINGLKAGETDIAKADMNKGEPDKPQGTQRVGPLIAAIRRYLIKKDPSLANDPQKLLKFSAKLWALQPVTLDNGAEATYYSSELLPYHIQYKPDEMREANVEGLGDDFFIERSEIIDTTAEVAQYVGAVREHGFAYPTKARYFFSHIIDAYDDMAKRGKKPGPDGQEFARAAENFQVKMRGNLDQWIERALQGHGGIKLLTEQHKNQDGRKIVATLLEKGLISRGVVEQLAARGVSAANILLKQKNQGPLVGKKQKNRGGSSSNNPSPSGSLAA